MIWNNDILFLHVPKTGGMSITTYLLNNLKGPLHYTAEVPDDAIERGRHHRGRRHETMLDAESYLGYYNRSISDFEAIFAVMRNPYDLEISRYHYLRKNHEVDRGPAQELAMAGNYQTYLRESSFFGADPPRLDRYYHLAGSMPDQLRILRFENLAADLHAHVSPYFHQSAHHELPRLNASKHDDYWTYYDATNEELCYQRHRWFFDKSFYPRRLDEATTWKRPAARYQPGSASRTATADPPPPFPRLDEIPQRLRHPSLFSLPLVERGRHLEALVAKALGANDLADTAVFDLDGDVALARTLLTEQRPLGGYTFVTTDDELADFLRVGVSDRRVRCVVADPNRADADDLLQRSAAVHGAEVTEPHDVVLALHPANGGSPSTLEQILRFARRFTKPGGRLLLGAMVAARSASGQGPVDRLLAASGSSGSDVLLSDEPTHAVSEEFSTWLYPQTALERLLTQTSWQLREIHDPSELAAHIAVCEAT